VADSANNNTTREHIEIFSSHAGDVSTDHKYASIEIPREAERAI